MPEEARLLDHDTLDVLRGRHPAWRLLRAEHAPLILSFLHRVFVLPNARAIAQPELTSRLEDYLWLRERLDGSRNYHVTRIRSRPAYACRDRSSARSCSCYDVAAHACAGLDNRSASSGARPSCFLTVAR